MACGTSGALERAIRNYADQLELDSIKPRPDYSIDGQTVSRAVWRESIARNIKELQDILQREEPYELRGFTT